jgi:hypothetical protein
MERSVVRRPNDPTPEPPGGRAAERLRMFEQARRPKEELPDKKIKKSGGDPNKSGSQPSGGKSNERKKRRKD